MKQKQDWIEKRQSTRREAEIVLAGVSPAEMVTQPTEVLLHELLVHKVELEMQIEELRRAHTAMEEARDRYVDLYDFAPVGYITVSRECLISEINLTAATLLGVDRTKLVNCRFSKFVSPKDRDRWHRLFVNMMEHAEIEKQAFVLEMMHADASSFHAHIDCRRRESTDTPPVLRLALFDISKIEQAKAEMGSVGNAVEAR